MTKLMELFELAMNNPDPNWQNYNRRQLQAFIFSETGKKEAELTELEIERLLEVIKREIDASRPPCDCGCPDNTPTQHRAFCARYGRFRHLRNSESEKSE